MSNTCTGSGLVCHRMSRATLGDIERWCYTKHSKVVSYLTDNTWVMLMRRLMSVVQSFRRHKVDE